MSTPRPLTTAQRSVLTTDSLTLDILVTLVEHSEFRLLASWRGTCKNLHRAVASHLRSRYVRCLRPFLTDLALFDELLIRHGAIVSGSVALQFFLPRSTWQPGDLDIYVPESQFDAFINAVTARRGLDFTLFPHRRPWDTVSSRETTVSPDDRPSDDGLPSLALDDSPDDESDLTDDFHVPSSHNGIREVRQFYTPTDRRVDIISVPSTNPVRGLKQFWASLVMNFIRPDLCVCGFPATTLEGVGILKPILTARDMKAAEKYVGRGFILADNPVLHPDAYWDTPFFGARNALVTSFGPNVAAKRSASPLVRTDRGWALLSSWTSSSTYHMPASVVLIYAHTVSFARTA